MVPVAPSLTVLGAVKLVSVVLKPQNVMNWLEARPVAPQPGDDEVMRGKVVL
jgi:hypothetical protein